MTSRSQILYPRTWLRGLLVAASLLLLPGLVSGQETVYQTSQLSEAPKIADAKQARTAIMRSYTTNLQDAGLEGRVELAFIVNADGSVDGGSVKILKSPEDALSKAATVAVSRIKFTPGKKDGQAVRCQVAMPISYTPGI